MTVIQILSSNEVSQQREAAWASVKESCDKVLEPESGRNVKFFHPTPDCGLLIHTICAEYPQQVKSPQAMLDAF